MENFILIGTILTIHVFAWFTPGPLFILILRNSLIHSRKSGLWTAVGIAVGNFIHIAYSVAGISLIISTSAPVLNTIKFLGVGYLVYLGIKTFFTETKSQETDVTTTKPRDISAFDAAKIGFTTNILSPKAALFFASIFAAIMSSSAPFWVVIILWIAMPLNSFVMASILSLLSTQSNIKTIYARYENIANKTMGVILLILAINIALHK